MGGTGRGFLDKLGMTFWWLEMTKGVNTLA